MESRRQYVEQRMQVLRDMWQRVRSIPTTSARQEGDTIDRELVKLRQERRMLDLPRWRQR